MGSYVCAAVAQLKVFPGKRGDGTKREPEQRLAHGHHGEQKQHQPPAFIHLVPLYTRRGERFRVYEIAREQPFP